jgi:hypothetical protein
MEGIGAGERMGWDGRMRMEVGGEKEREDDVRHEFDLRMYVLTVFL